MKPCHVNTGLTRWVEQPGSKFVVHIPVNEKDTARAQAEDSTPRGLSKPEIALTLTPTSVIEFATAMMWHSESAIEILKSDPHDARKLDELLDDFATLLKATGAVDDWDKLVVAGEALCGELVRAGFMAALRHIVEMWAATPSCALLLTETVGAQGRRITTEACTCLILESWHRLSCKGLADSPADLAAKMAPGTTLVPASAPLVGSEARALTGNEWPNANVFIRKPWADVPELVERHDMQ
eukprot:439716-Amphidinium_carterae.1